MDTKNDILNRLSEKEKNIKEIFSAKEGFKDVTDYSFLVRENKNGERIWTDAFSRAISENEKVYIPFSPEPYLIDDTIIIPSFRTVKAHENAVIRQTEGTKVLLIRNEHTVDGSRYQPECTVPDRNIAIIGGRWEESYRERAGYGKSGMYDLDRSYYGVSACMLFNNIENLYMSDVTFSHTAGFSVQTGQIKGCVFENIYFDNCFADGLHINGNSEDVVIRNISGNVGDDLVALNMYDWQHSSVNFGPVKTVLCENLILAPEATYKAMRIQPGVYYFDDGSSTDCSAENMIIRNIRGINTFKVYYQTPAYDIGTKPERGSVGSGNNLFFENIEIDLKYPIDCMQPYLESDPVRGNFGAFELGADFNNVYFESVKAALYTDKFPMCGLISVGPKSVRSGSREIFDPYLSSSVQKLHYKDICINGEKIEDIRPYVRISEYNDINHDNNSTGKGSVSEYIKEA